MELEEAIENIKEQIHNENGEHWNYIDIDNFYDDECENFICSIETVLKDLEKQDKIIELMAEHISFGEDIQKILCFPKVHKEGACTCITCKRCIKQYFEKKSEESE